MKTRTQVVRFARRAPREEIPVRFQVDPDDDPEVIAELIQDHLNLPIDELQLDSATHADLQNFQITRLWELLRLSVEDLTDRGFRPHAVRQIQQAVAGLAQISLFRSREDYFTALGKG